MFSTLFRSRYFLIGFTRCNLRVKYRRLMRTGAMHPLKHRENLTHDDRLTPSDQVFADDVGGPATSQLSPSPRSSGLRSRINATRRNPSTAHGSRANCHMPRAQHTTTSATGRVMLIELICCRRSRRLADCSGSQVVSHMADVQRGETAARGEMFCLHGFRRVTVCTSGQSDRVRRSASC
jgi:hypothetical protein